MTEPQDPILAWLDEAPEYGTLEVAARRMRAALRREVVLHRPYPRVYCGACSGYERMPCPFRQRVAEELGLKL